MTVDGRRAPRELVRAHTDDLLRVVRPLLEDSAAKKALDEFLEVDCQAQHRIDARAVLGKHVVPLSGNAESALTVTAGRD